MEGDFFQMDPLEFGFDEGEDFDEGFVVRGAWYAKAWERSIQKEKLEVAEKANARPSDLAFACRRALVGINPRDTVDRWLDVAAPELLDDLLQESASLFLRNSLATRKMSWDRLRCFLRYTGGLMFGSCPAAAVLGENWYGDVDLLIPSGFQNNEIRWWANQIFEGNDFEEVYAPRMICKHAADVNGDPLLFQYHRRHESAWGVIDVVESPDPLKLLNCRLLDVDLLVFDGERFRFVNDQSSRSLTEWARRPTCRVIQTGSGLAFEEFYDAYCLHCREPKQPRRLVEHLGMTYVESANPTGNEKLRLEVLVMLGLGREGVLPSWLAVDDFRDLARLRDLVVPRFREFPNHVGGFLTEYLVVKLFLRLMKLILRGISCVNFDECFTSEVTEFPPPCVPMTQRSSSHEEEADFSE